MKYQVQFTFEAANLEDGQYIAQVLMSVLDRYKIPARHSPVIELDLDEAETVVVYTDGGCDLKKNGIGAWGYRAKFPDGNVEEDCGVFIGTTNNRMELMAVINALERLEVGVPIKIVSDSEYVVKGVTQWSRNWVRNGWKTRDGKPVLNKDLWQKLLNLFEVHTVTFKHVKGHNGNPDNEYVDKMCTAAMLNAHKEVLAGGSVDVDEGAAKQG